MLQKTGPELDGHSLITSGLVEEYRGREKEPVDGSASGSMTEELASALDFALASFDSCMPAGQVVHRLAGDLHRIRRAASPEIWRQAIPFVQRHAVSEFLMQDPFTRWSFEKPRGYSGDATLLDIYYKHPSIDGIVAASTKLGREIHAYTSEAESSVAGRERREILARTVDQTADRVGRAEVLAVACGHLREAELSSALSDGKIERWIGLDQDPASVETVNADLSGSAVKAVEGSVKGILRRAYGLGTFDLVYASGLYDYLPFAVAVKLLQRLLEMVKPGGEFLFANFTDEITTDGYMETFMDWPLILRNAGDMQDIIDAAVGPGEDADVFYGANRNVVYGRIRKPSA